MEKQELDTEQLAAEEQPAMVEPAETEAQFADEVTPSPEPEESEELATNDNNLRPVVNQAQPSIKASKPGHKKRLIILISLAVIVIAVVVVGVILLLGHHKQPEPVTATVKKSAPVVKQNTSQTTTPTMLAAPQTMANLALFPTLGDDCRSVSDGTDCPSPSDVHYYQIGKRPDGTLLIIATVPSQGPNVRGVDTYVLSQDPKGAYTIYGSEAQTVYDSMDKSKVTLDAKNFLPELNLPSTATVSSLALAANNLTTPVYGFFINGLADFEPQATSTPKKIGSQNGFDYYDVLAKDYGSFQVHEVFGAASTSYAVPYSLAGGMAIKSGDDGQAITWSDKSKNSDEFTSHSPGCGFGYGFMTLPASTVSSLVTAGTDPAGETVYTLPTTDPFLQKVYSEDYASGQYLDAKYQNLSIQQFEAAHAVVVVKNGAGQYVAYLNESYIQGGGCAKPVEYLYPTKTTQVSLSVGAVITKSDPLYGANGWQHVTAQPNGQLTYQGKAYDSLFWEGLGLGNYPAITSGTVVPQNQVVNTIRTQLAAQGLNTKETQDFLNYWQPKLPKTPFVRLSWLTTAELNELAPLHITPAPQTVIRTFLDAQGLNLPINIAPQTFTAPTRQGFTLVEWGGLLR